jgi:hypothetical protein
MSEFLVAYFHTQLDAVTSARKLQTCGVQRERMTIHAPRESTNDDGPASLATEANAKGAPGKPPEHAHLPQGNAFSDFTDIEQGDVEPTEIPGLDASTTLTITLNDRPPIDDVCTLLKDAGAYLIDVTERNVAQQYPDM